MMSFGDFLKNRLNTDMRDMDVIADIGGTEDGRWAKLTHHIALTHTHTHHNYQNILSCKNIFFKVFEKFLSRIALALFEFEKRNSPNEWKNISTAKMISFNSKLDADSHYGTFVREKCMQKKWPYQKLWNS